MVTARHTPATKLLLSLLAHAGGATIDFYTFFHDLRHHRSAYLQGGHGLVKEFKLLRQEKAARQAFYRLRQARYIKAEKIGRRLIVSLTEKGLAATFALQLRQAPRRTDGLYTVVIFDIPETAAPARRQFRLLLRQGGFRKLQQSVWVSRGDTYGLMVKVIKQLQLGAWVNTFRAKDFLHLP